MLKRLLHWPPVQAMLAGLLGRYLEFAFRTTRWTLVGVDEHLAPYLAQGPAVLAFWHERLALMSAGWRLMRARNGSARAYVLVSRHSDGRFIGQIVRRFGVDLAFGSSDGKGHDRGGAAGARTLLGVLQAGGLVVITPDGPRGPRRVAAPGVAELAAWSGAPVVPCAGQTSRRWMLPTWDRMVLPLPFGRGTIVCGPPIQVARDEAAAALPRVAAALIAVTEEADALCR